MDDVTGRWAEVPPVRGAYVVNIGNLMMRWTNHTFNSALYRVLNYSGKDRYSIPFFFDGDSSVLIDCIPGCEEGGKREPPIFARDFLQMQVSKSYSKREAGGRNGNRPGT
ncbi:hypothetical protein EDD36DRAFT_433905 [Exophiala viscosa]|uniref:Isopenicillin N synthase-like Fe(2+) 2OG dioxygenase domain-containing protein n=1 Tax=Exophiala viscosa TaxID=2486360 RepID=A0AAN6DYA7_9EURO|nr:hypothetical protein EDD36DRAFT_433905 [Exophiala viscosa]